MKIESDTASMAKAMHDVSVRQEGEEKVGESIFRAGANPFFYKFTQTKRSILFISVA